MIFPEVTRIGCCFLKQEREPDLGQELWENSKMGLLGLQSKQRLGLLFFTKIMEISL